ncbi:MAG: hypothetical protein WCK67_00755 [bacterium]
MNNNTQVENAKFLFLRETSKKTLYRLADLIEKDPYPLFKATRAGLFKGIKREAINYLEEKKQTVKLHKTKQDLQTVIDLLYQE